MHPTSAKTRCGSRAPDTSGAKPRSWSVDELLAAGGALRCPAGLARRARVSLWDDLTSEYDARLLSAHVHALPIAYTPEFRAAEAAWARDEELHHRAMRRAYAELFGFGDDERERLGARRADFAPIAQLFGDELAILVLYAYDELATVRAYAANLPLYDRLGPAMGRIARHVVADEAWHYSLFLGVLRTRHAHRLREAAALVRRVRAAEGTPYAATFVFDHDGDPIWCEGFCDEAARLLVRQLAVARR